MITKCRSYETVAERQSRPNLVRRVLFARSGTLGSRSGDSASAGDGEPGRRSTLVADDPRELGMVSQRLEVLVFASEGGEGR